MAEVIAKCFDLFVNERDLPVLAALALADGEEPVLEIDVLEPKGSELAESGCRFAGRS